MSYLNLAKLTEDSVTQLGLTEVMSDLTNDPSFESTRDGEEFEFVVSFLRALEKLDNGELLIISVDRF